jgi:Tol biopolymer transport system component
MALSVGTRFGPYEVGEPIGSGGMGEVYRATDTNLKRDVAVKVLPESFASDPERLARFQREAEVLASLNHPNIATIHGLEKSDGRTIIVMELVEGPTLAERIENGPLPPDEALGIARQIVDALAAAHGRQIVHRDLKPANVKLKADGTVKVLDFGISKPIDTQAISGGQSPIATTPAVTETGVIVGTAAYMSPEQARGKPVDERTDIWAFGCLLFEMLTGQPAFGGEDVMMTLARVLDRDTDLDSLPRAISPAVRNTIALCLRKDPRKRLHAFGDVRLALEGEIAAGGQPATESGSAAGDEPRWRRAMPLAATVIIAVLVTGIAAWILRPTPPPRPLNRFSYTLPQEQTLRLPVVTTMALAPDGRRFVYNTTDGFYLRSMDALEARLIPGTEDTAANPFFSPDGQSIGYFVPGAQVERIAITGGASVVIGDFFGAPFGASWAADGTIYFGQPDGIYRVPATGGARELVVPAEEDERLHGPSLLPDGDSLLFSAAPPSDPDAGEIVVQSLATGERTPLFAGGNDAHYVPTGHLVYAFEDGLFGIAFDLKTLSVSGGPVPLEQGVMRASVTPSANYGIATDGTLVYVAGTATQGTRSLAWVDRDGREEPLAIEPSNYDNLRISPDGRRVALDDRNVDGDLWIWDFEAQTRTRLNVGDNGGSNPAWTADGSRVAFGAGLDLYWRAANNTGAAERLLERGQGQNNPAGPLIPYFFTPDGSGLVFGSFRGNARTEDDIGIISLGGDDEPVWLLNESYDEHYAELSPDGRWMAYQSAESGREEVYVRPFPNLDDDLVQVSNNGGRFPLWSRDGRELFYLEGPPMRLMVVAVDPSDTSFGFTERARLFEWPYRGAPGESSSRPYDVSTDGQRFLAIFDGATSETTTEIIVVENWTEKLQRLVPRD